MYKANQPAVVFEKIDGELIIINTLNGFYYSGTGNAVFLWEAVTSGWTPDQLKTFFVSIGHPFGSTTVIADYIRILLDESLIVTVEGSAEEKQPSLDAALIGDDIPVLSKYSDLHELIELDPIHEVESDMGWPVQKKG